MGQQAGQLPVPEVGLPGPALVEQAAGGRRHLVQDAGTAPPGTVLRPSFHQADGAEHLEVDTGRVGVQADRSSRFAGVERAADLVQGSQERLAALAGQGAVGRLVVARQHRHRGGGAHRGHGYIITRPGNKKRTAEL